MSGSVTSAGQFHFNLTLCLGNLAKLSKAGLSRAHLENQNPAPDKVLNLMFHFMWEFSPNCHGKLGVIREFHSDTMSRHAS